MLHNLHWLCKNVCFVCLLTEWHLCDNEVYVYVLEKMLGVETTCKHRHRCENNIK